MDNKFQYIVFDVGHVLIDFDFTPFEIFLRKYKPLVTNRSDFIHKTQLIDYELGQITSEQFITNVKAILSQKVSSSELKANWVQIFTPITEMIELLKLLTSQIPIFLLSNTNELHWQYLEENYQLHKMVNGVLTSFGCGSAKPERAIFSCAEKKFGLDPQKTIFIDDLAENIEAASKLGWTGILHQSISQTVEELSRLGISSTAIKLPI